MSETPRQASEPPSATPHAPPTAPSPIQYAPPSNEGDATGGVIPYKNVPALVAYYLGIFSFLPLVGVAALILGIMGLRARQKNPVIRGAVHAWIGIVLGGLATLLYGLIIVLTIVEAL